MALERAGNDLDHVEEEDIVKEAQALSEWELPRP